MKAFILGWYVIYAVLCVSAHPVKKRGSEARREALEIYDLQTMASAPIFEDTSRDRLSRVAKNNFADYVGVLIPLKSTTVPKNNFPMMAMPLEPDAEMLPAHYTGVVPPGVDHMELKRTDPESLESNPRIIYLVEPSGSLVKPKSLVQVGGTQNSTSKGVTGAVKRGSTTSKAGTLEKASKGNVEKQKQRSEYAEANGKKKEHSEEAKASGNQEDRGEGASGADYEKYDARAKERKASGYHNVYHKDERKKDADYYKNHNEGGQFKKHGHYNEKHVATEGERKKGSSGDSSRSEGGSGKQGMFEKSRVTQEAKGHDAQQGYDGFFKNFQGFGKEGESGKGGKFGFLNKKAR